VARAAVILGGRQPARAVAHFRRLREQRAANQGLCVLDRDDTARGEQGDGADPGLEFFTWSRRHIESYLLVPSAIRRGLRLAAGDLRVARFFRERLPSPDDERAFREVDAKRLLARKGELENALGRSLPPGRIARAMRPEELHGDIRLVLERLREGMGLPEADARVTVRGVPSRD
jgi:hypothetical protein